MQIDQLFLPKDRPPWLDGAITTSGLLSQPKKFAREWEAVLANAEARMTLAEWVMSVRPDDGEKSRKIHVMMRALANDYR